MLTIQDLEKYLGYGIEENHSLLPLLTMRLDIHAPFFFQAESREDLINARLASVNLNIPLVVIGGGSNLAILNLKPDSLVIQNTYREKKLVKEDETHVFYQFSSGYPVSLLVREMNEAGYGGLEYHLGLPGTLGGAIYMNSKWTKPVSYFGDNLVEAELLDKDGNVKSVTRDYFNFAYDYSILQNTGEIVLNVTFKLVKTDKNTLLQRAQKALEYRRETQPMGMKTAGCFFRNVSEETQKKYQLPSKSASYLIDHAGLKGTKIGDFMVSEQHANFIINEGRGHVEDLDKLRKLIKEKVQKKYKVILQEEVVVI